MSSDDFKLLIFDKVTVKHEKHINAPQLLMTWFLVLLKKQNRKNCFFTHKYSILLHSQWINSQEMSMPILSLSGLSVYNIPSYFETYPI
jgi:hypothetical protein